MMSGEDPLWPSASGFGRRAWELQEVWLTGGSREWQWEPGGGSRPARCRGTTP